MRQSLSGDRLGRAWDHVVPFFGFARGGDQKNDTRIDKRCVSSGAMFSWRGRLAGEEWSLGWKLERSLI
jgi:hypothetical protein